MIGLVAAALGLERTAPLDRFASLRFGVRIDRPGRIERDFQTARTLDGKTSMPLSQRRYLADAVFVAGLEGEGTELLDEIQSALRRPRYPLYLGRRAFPPAGPLRTEIVNGPLQDALENSWWPETVGGDTSPLEILVDAVPGEDPDLTLEDIPISFDPRRRRYGRRDVRLVIASRPGAGAAEARPDASASGGFSLPPHDPMLLVSDEEV
ncbi:type I-E CRISPR-associated protein Cas5/CasD [Microbacterium tumbae]